jgi:hypothetical protein
MDSQNCDHSWKDLAKFGYKKNENKKEASYIVDYLLEPKFKKWVNL